MGNIMFFFMWAIVEFQVCTCSQLLIVKENSFDLIKLNLFFHLLELAEHSFVVLHGYIRV